MNIKLTKPIAFLDVESTGLDTVKDRIVTLAIVKIHPAMSNEPYAWQYAWQFNPCVEMTPDNIAIHGITNEMVRHWPIFGSRAREIHQALTGCDLAGFNLRHFDVPIIWEELYRCGIEWDLDGVNIVDVSVIFKKKEPRDLTAAVAFYLNREHDSAHGAMADTIATLDVFEEQTKGRHRYGDISAMSVPELSRYCNLNDKDQSQRLDLAGTVLLRKDGVPVFGTKRNKDVPIADDLGYADWMLRADFPAQTRLVLRKIVDQIRNQGQEGLF